MGDVLQRSLSLPFLTGMLVLGLVSASSRTNATNAFAAGLALMLAFFDP
jgi:hypothetical protein